jgi:RNA polymerase sigma-70 factor (ECF subfamily)
VSSTLQADEVLMQRIQAGDALAFQQLVRQHIRALHGFARRLLGNSSEAEDIVQETFIRVWHKAAQWQVGRAKLSTWLHSITYHLYIDMTRRHHMQTVSLDDVIEDAERVGLSEVSEQVQREEIIQEVEAALQQLPERQRSAIVLCYYQNMSNHEAAEILSISVSALESLLARGRRSLREKLQARLENGS